MKTATAIIGANYGDEGKGAVTRHLARKADIVIRFSGGAQAGHTVELETGHRHVFHHFGCGTLDKIPTYLSKHFIVNPILAVQEHIALQDLHCTPVLYVDPTALVTTPFDMLINQAVERKRGALRHGSCGIGINETVERSQHPEFKITVMDLMFPTKLHKTIASIAMKWNPHRIQELALDGFFFLPKIIEQFAGWVNEFNLISVCTPSDFLQRYERLVFEGAQGLGLDQSNGNFPHVTRANTGVKNVFEIAHSLELEKLDLWYVTRPYVTRHGAGPLSHEQENLFSYAVDTTNVTNEFQQSLRRGYLDAEEFQRRVLLDCAESPWQPNVWVTCLDQVPERVPVICNGEMIQFKREAVAPFLAGLVCGKWQESGNPCIALERETA